jgi:outer membrane protein OmpA-like peptidoglycan-associated protein
MLTRRVFLPTLTSPLAAPFAAMLMPALPARAQHRAAPPPPLALPAGMSPLRDGAYRVAFLVGQSGLQAGMAPTLAEIGRRLAAAHAQGSGRITIEGHASGPVADASAARRVSLARATAVRDALVAGGLEETRIDVRALGRTNAALDAADILPPGAVRAGERRPGRS